MKAQNEFFNEINILQEEVAKLQEEYWLTYSNIDTWQFWVMVATMILPLIVLVIAIDKTKLFLILFFTLNIHVWFAYIDSIGVRRAYWEYPYTLTPYFPFSLSLDGALAPVAFMLVYQWTLNKQKNFYLYATGLAAFFSFIFKPFLVSINLFGMNNGFNYFYLFLLYCLLFLISIGITNIFIKFKKLSNQ
ncbi:CBO0543 family protein [Paraliobacillus sediminis]|uniref:CBO0543 family protein n=1 Tax=Paraliobacillus sediminis TaxID=1885916 RepID=UPI000E3C91A2|nr:CBO0543 family protein [Paraliobacillus sediminis]